MGSLVQIGSRAFLRPSGWRLSQSQTDRRLSSASQWTIQTRPGFPDLLLKLWSLDTWTVDALVTTSAMGYRPARTVSCRLPAWV